jgi:O-glycosyl hydrolase
MVYLELRRNNMSDKINIHFPEVANENKEVVVIESRGYKKAVKSFQIKYPDYKQVMVEWYNNKKLNHKLQKLPLGRKKKTGR